MHIEHSCCGQEQKGKEISPMAAYGCGNDLTGG